MARRRRSQRCTGIERHRRFVDQNRRRAPPPSQICKIPTSSPANPPFQILQIPHFKPCKSPNKASARPGMRLDWPRGHQRDHGRQLSSARRRPSHGSRARVDRRSHSGRPSWLRQDHDGSRARIVLHAARHTGGANGRRGRSASAAGRGEPSPPRRVADRPPDLEPGTQGGRLLSRARTFHSHRLGRADRRSHPAHRRGAVHPSPTAHHDLGGERRLSQRRRGLTESAVRRRHTATLDVHGSA